jgi:hypothetical protein
VLCPTLKCTPAFDFTSSCIAVDFAFAFACPCAAFAVATVVMDAAICAVAALSDGLGVGLSEGVSAALEGPGTLVLFAFAAALWRDAWACADRAVSGCR